MIFGSIQNKRIAERGATALMIVVFSVLLLMTISVLLLS